MFENRDEYRPSDKLIRVRSPRMTIIVGAVIIVTGIIFVVVALTEGMEARRRRHQNVRLIRIGVVAVGLATMAAGTGIVVVGHRRRRRLLTEGRLAQAEVIGSWQRWRWTKYRQHYVAYGFVAQLPDGTTSVVGCWIADPMLYHQLRIGDEFTVRYLPSNLRIGAPVMPRRTKKSRAPAASEPTVHADTRVRIGSFSCPSAFLCVSWDRVCVTWAGPPGS